MYRAAIIGCGRIASLLEQDPRRSKPHTHAGWYRAHPAVELVAGSDIDERRLARFGSDWGIPANRLYTDYREMLREQRPDIVSVAAFAPERLEMCLAAIDAGARGLWVEKAVACSLAEADRLQAAAAAHGVSVIVDHPRRTDSRYRAVREIIEAGRLGPLETVHAVFSGGLIHTGTHAWDLLDFWCGPWQSVRAWLDPVPELDPPGGEHDGPGAKTGWASARGVSRSSEPVLRDRGGRVHVTFGNAVHGFVSGSAKDYFVFQFDLLFRGGRVQLGNDVCRVLEPADSPRYTGFLELAHSQTLRLHAPYGHPMLDDLVHALETGGQPAMSLANAVVALELGIASIQAGLENRSLAPADVRRDLWVHSV
jgi:predicted dehydrogenase